MKIQPKWIYTIFMMGLLALVIVKYWDSGVAFLMQILSSMSSLIIGVVLAYIINIVMTQYEKLFTFLFNGKASGMKRPVSLILALCTFIAFVILFILMVVPEIIRAVQTLANIDTQALTESLRNIYTFINVNWISNALESNVQAVISNYQAQLQEMLISWVQQLASGIGTVLNSIIVAISSVFSALFSFLVSIIFALYILSSKESLKSQVKKVLETYIPKSYPTISYVYQIVNNSFKNFIIGQSTEGMILGLLCFTGMMIFQFPYALVTSVMIGVTALIPIVGAYIGVAIGAFLIFTMNPMQALLFVVYIVILMQFEGNLIYPRVVGGSIGLPGMWVLASIAVGAGVYGIIGMLLAVPLVAAAYALLKNDIRKRNNEKVGEKETL